MENKKNNSSNARSSSYLASLKIGILAYFFNIIYTTNILTSKYKTSICKNRVVTSIQAT